MTAKRNLKRRVRERQVRTGESYTAALRHVRDPKPKPFPVDELFDITDVAAPLGIKCPVKIYSSLSDRVEVVRLLERLRDVLVATERDRAMDVMRAVVLHGRSYQRARTTVIRETVATYARRWGFLTRARAGIGGINDEGDMLSMTVEARAGVENVLFKIVSPYRGGTTSLEISTLRDDLP